MTVHDVFSRLAAARFLPDLRGVNATYCYDIKGAGKWRAIVRDGTVEVEEGVGGVDCDVDCTLICDAPDFVDIVAGRRKTITALMQGRLTYRGSIEHLLHQVTILGLDQARAGEAAAAERREEVRP